MLKKTFVAVLVLLICVTAQAQDDKGENIKPFRIGAKIGVPNIVGGNVELVFAKRIGLYADYSSFSGDFDDVAVSFNFFEIGTNIYFKTTGKGFYGSFSYSSFSIDGTYTDAQTIGGQNFTGEATGSLEINTVNAKLGLKLGRSFYFRTEVGYGFGTVPDEVVITGNVNGVSATGTEEIPDIPGISSSGLLIFNIGFGIAF